MNSCPRIRFTTRTRDEELTGGKYDLCACTFVCMCSKCMWRGQTSACLKAHYTGTTAISPQDSHPCVHAPPPPHSHTSCGKALMVGCHSLTKRCRWCKKWGPVTQGSLVVKLWANVCEISSYATPGRASWMPSFSVGSDGVTQPAF